MPDITSESFQPHSLHFTFSGLEESTSDVWLWFILSIDLVSITFYTIPTSISFFREKVFKILVLFIITALRHVFHTTLYSVV